MLIETGGGKEPPLEALLTANGYAIAGRIGEQDDWIERLQDSQADAIVVGAATPSRRLLAKIESLSRQEPRPIALFCDEGETGQINAAVSAGVNALVTGRDRSETLVPTIDLAMAHFKETEKLLKERDHATEALAERKLIERAKGIVMKQRGLSEDEAYKFLRQAAMDRGVRLGRLAASILETEELLS